MNGKLVLGIIAVAFIVSVFVGNIIMLTVHESSHAIVLLAAGIPYDFSVNPFSGSYARPLAPVPNPTYQIFNLVGGLGAALVMGLLFVLATRLEKRSQRMLLGAVGVEAAFLYLTLHSVGNAIWEGLLTESYQNLNNWLVGRALLIGFSLALSVGIVIKLKLDAVKGLVRVNDEESAKPRGAVSELN